MAAALHRGDDALKHVPGLQQLRFAGIFADAQLNANFFMRITFNGVQVEYRAVTSGK
jgi:hypothetical protein